MQTRALGLGAAVFVVSAVVALVTVRQVWEATTARDGRWLAQSAEEVPAHLGERIHCLDASLAAMRGMLAARPVVSTTEWEAWGRQVAGGATCPAVKGLAYLEAGGTVANGDAAPAATRVAFRSERSGAGAVSDETWLQLLAAMRPADLAATSAARLGPALPIGSTVLALYLAPVVGPADAAPASVRGWAALLIAPADLFSTLIDGEVMGLRVEDPAGSGPQAILLDTAAPGQAVVARRDIDVGGRPLVLAMTDARRTTTGTRSIVGVVTLLGALQTGSLAWLVYTLAASRERLAQEAAASHASLRREEAETRKLSLVARHATDLILLTDPLGRIEWANAAFLRANGYAEDDVVGQVAWTLLHGPETPLDAVEAVRAALTSGQGCRVETVNYTKARVPYWVSFEIQPVHDAAGVVTTFIAVARDITAERRAQDALQLSEQQYRRVVEQVEQVIFQLDTDGQWTFLNRAWHDLTGYDVSATIGHPFAGYVHPDDRVVAQEMCAGMLAGRRDECRQELRFVTHRGSACWTAVHARPVIEEGLFIGVAGTITDVSVRRQAEQELERARVAAEKANAAKSEFLKSMSHEMRTPLNGVLGLMELLGATRLDAQQARYVAVARASATHLATLISDILDLSRIDGGALTLERTLFDLPDLVESSLDVLASAAAARRLRLSCTVTQDVPTWVIGDPGRLRQVLVHLLANAVKFTEQGEVHVQASAQVDLHTRQAILRLDVHDTGIGMAPEVVERLFRPFTPGDASSTRRHSGTGLGLTICKRLVEAMQGTIAVRSIERAGATFTVSLPLEVADAAMVESQRQGDVPLRVLAVLPDDRERETIGRLLEGWRFDAAVVGDCATALGHVRATTPSRWRFGVVLLDGLAPGAASLAQQLREMSPEPGIVWVMPEDGHLPADVSGVREQVERPVRGAALFDAIMQAVVGAGVMPVDGTRAPDWGRPRRVLVAEDHAINQMVVREMLLAMGLEVDVVGNGEAAVAAALAVPYDVILMDCQMPVLDGLEATRHIRRALAVDRGAPAPRIIALTANATAADRRACLDAGMDAYLTKPVRSTVLQRTLQRLLAIDGAVALADEEATAASVTTATPTADLVPEALLGDTPDAEDILDPAEVLLRCNNNGDLGARMLVLFAESLPAELERLDAAAAADDAVAMASIAHKIRGAAATLAAVRLAGAISGVELFLKYGDGGPLSELLGDVRHESALFLGVVPQIVRRLTDGPARPRA
ncbi:PAS domain-containing hybrid sensor histidine kinase/response regulator [Luteitalea sp.]|uniref:PAS domain-containing hybrid sensor histidine kinase/response regulator n=1 Tax=Luteitalea sp. TaxID=2004800 RepID=UPI0025BC90F2|nr:PAS domain-containing hybrid sensor histidine kinase/response regulator [Luteitalea sp.]